MRVFIISRGYPSEKYVTNGIFEFDQAKALAKQGHEVIFLANDLRSLRRKRKFGSESFIKDGVQIEALNIPCGKIPKGLLMKIRSTVIQRLYNRCVRKYGKPDIVHSHFLEISYCTVKALKDKGVPLVMTEHLSTMNNTVIPENLIALGNNTYKYYDKVIAVGKQIAETIENNFGVEAEIIPNVADTESFSLRNLPVRHNGFRVISVGALIKRKHMDLLIEAFTEFAEKHDDVSLEIFGKGEERENLEKLIAENNMRSAITLHGAKPREEIAESMQKADCFVLASDVETFGVVYIEAMAMGLPVIATKSGGPENFVNDTNGILIEPNDKDILVKSLEKMYDTYKQYDKGKIKDNVIKNFSPDAVAEQLSKLYRQTIKTISG